MLAWVGSQVRVVRFALGAAAFGYAALLVGCGLDMSGLLDTSGVDGGGEDAFAADATLDVSSPDTGSADTGSSDAGGGNDATAPDSGTADSAPLGRDSGNDSSSGLDASSVDGCVPKGPENCTDGIDNDCNGAIDCADTACMSQGYACVSPAPGGWSFVAFAPSTPPSVTACPTSLQTTSVDVDPIDTPANCSCTCDVGTPPTCTGMVSTKFGTNGTCPTGGGSAPADASCGTVPVSVGAYMQASNPAGSGGSCVANPSTDVPSPGSTAGEICSGQHAFGAGCSTGLVCALVPAPFSACVAKNGQVACPAQSPYTTVHYAGQLNDTRSCTNCQCGGTPMCGLTWSFYNSPKCNANAALVLTPNGTCQATGAQATAYVSNMLTGDPATATCSPPNAQPMPTGQVALNAEQTVCCE
jgi:hypothetical protein